MASNSTNGHYYDQGNYTAFNPRVLLTAVIVLIIITSIYILLHLCSRYFFGPAHIVTVGLIRNMNSVHPSNHLPRRSGLCPSIISALPVFPYRSMKEGFDEEEGFDECTVCLGQLEEGEKVKMLPRCKHLFHVDCIDMWLHSHSTCPVCRANAEPPDESVGPAGSIGVIMRELDNNNVKDVGASSGLGNSFRRMISVDRSAGGRRTQAGGELVEDLERQ